MKPALKLSALALAALAGCLGSPQASVLVPDGGVPTFGRLATAASSPHADGGARFNPEETRAALIVRTSAAPIESGRASPAGAAAATDHQSIPEPQTYGLMLAGLGLLGAMALRRLGEEF